MKSEIRKILFNGITYEGQETFEKDIDNCAGRIAERLKAFILWKDDLRCPFEVIYNGTDKTKDKIYYKKSDKFYTLDEVWQYWIEHLK